MEPKSPNPLSDKEFRTLVGPVWDYLVIREEPAKADVILTFGGVDMLIPRKAARLWYQQYSPILVTTGAAGPFTKERFNKAEAEVFADEAVRLGVATDSILIEPFAKNTGQNVEFSMRLLAEEGHDIRSAVLVMKPFLARRCAATVQQQQPSIHAVCCPPEGDVLIYIDRPLEEFAVRLTEEVDRLAAYSTEGFIVPQAIPATVRERCELIKERLASQ